MDTEARVLLGVDRSGGGRVPGVYAHLPSEVCCVLCAVSRACCCVGGEFPGQHFQGSAAVLGRVPGTSGQPRAAYPTGRFPALSATPVGQSHCGRCVPGRAACVHVSSARPACLCLCVSE